MTERSLKELNWWVCNLERVNGFPIKNVAGIKCFSSAIFLAGDASAEGAFLGRIDHDSKTLLSVPFSRFKSEQSSTFREILVFQKFYSSDEVLNFRNKKIVHFTDSQVAVKVLTVGSKQTKIQDMVVDIMLKCRNLGIILQPEWLRRNSNCMVWADLGSRGPWFLLDEFQMDFFTYSWIFSSFNFTIDCFATRLNRCCARYISVAFEHEA